MRAYAVHGFKVLRVHQLATELVTVHFKAVQNAETHVIDTALHGAVHRLGVVGVVMLRARGMQLFVAFLVVGLLEQDVRADAGFL